MAWRGRVQVLFTVYAHIYTIKSMLYCEMVGEMPNSNRKSAGTIRGNTVYAHIYTIKSMLYCEMVGEMPNVLIWATQRRMVVGSVRVLNIPTQALLHTRSIL